MRSGCVRRWQAAATSALILALVSVAASGQDYPARPIRMIVGYAPGGATDLVARMVARHLSEVLGQQVIVDNRPGAAGTVGAELVSRSTPDGHTFLMAASPEVVIAPSVYRKLPYVSTRDFAPVTQVAIGPFMLVVHASIPASDVKVLIAYAKARPRQLNFASGGNGTAIHLTGELFKTMAGIDMVHVPYKGSGPAVADLVAGQVQVMFETIAIAMPHVKTGRLKSLGMATNKRSPAAPELPTIAESGLPGFSGGTWYGLFAREWGSVPEVSPQIIARCEVIAVDG